LQPCHVYFAVLPINFISADVILDLSSSLIAQVSLPYSKVGIQLSSLWRQCLSKNSLSRGGKVEPYHQTCRETGRFSCENFEHLQVSKQLRMPNTVYAIFLFINYCSDVFRPQFLVSETGFRDYFIWRKVERRCLDTQQIISLST